MVCSSAEFAEAFVSYLGVDSPAASAPGTLGVRFGASSGPRGRGTFVVDRGGWEVERVQLPGDAWRDAHDDLEATLFDVRTGTILFTVYERVEGKSGENVWQNDRKRRQLKEGLLAKAAEKLAEEVVSKSRRLASARPAKQDAPKAAAVSASGGAAPSP